MRDTICKSGVWFRDMQLEKYYLVALSGLNITIKGNQIAESTTLTR